MIEPKVTTLSTLFDITYGVNLELNKMTVCDKSHPEAINFVSRTDKNNGVAAIVKKVDTIIPNPANTISVAGGGSVLASFLQYEPYYSGRDLYVLFPKKPMTEVELLFYCHCIRMNRYKYNYGRQANRTLGKINVPAVPPLWLTQVKANIDQNIATSYSNKIMSLEVGNWAWFKCSQLFNIERGKGPRLNELTKEGNIPFVTSTDQNNGWNGVSSYSVHLGNVISVARNGSVGEAFYQPVRFASTEDVHIFNPKFPMNVYIALFFVTILKREKYRYNYGRKWGMQRMNDTYIKLPTTNNGKPNFTFMENYIKSLPYSSSLETDVVKDVPIVNVIKPKKNGGLSDKELIEKYDTGKHVDFDRALKKMAKTPSPTTLSKLKK
jgi:hypothetical protein